jgi:hypothetical protein
MDGRLRGPDVRHHPRSRARGASARAAAGADALQQLPGRHQDAPNGVPLVSKELKKGASSCPAKSADMFLSPLLASTKVASVIRLEKSSEIKVIVLTSMLSHNLAYREIIFYFLITKYITDQHHRVSSHYPRHTRNTRTVRIS